MNDPGPVELLHRCTRHGERSCEPGLIVPFRPLDAANRPAPFKRYPDIAARELPRELVHSSLPAVEVLSGEAGETRPLDWDLLGTLLFLGAGVSRVRERGDDKTWYTTAMSAGNLHPVEVYVLHGGLWHYQPLEHALVPLRPASGTGAERSGALLVLTGIPFRTCWKYRERGWRHLFWDAGTLAANVLEVAAAHGVPAEVEIGFDDVAVSELVGIDPAEELPLAILRIGEGEVRVPPAGSLAPLSLRSSDVAPRLVQFPLLAAAQAAGMLHGEDVIAWREAAAAACRPAVLRVERRPAGGDGRTIEDVVLRRGSTRSFRPGTAPADLLEWGLAAAARGVEADVTADSGTAPGTLLEHVVSVHAIDGRPAGRASIGEGGALEYLGSAADARTAREESAALCLDQHLGGDSAYTVFHCCDLATLFEHLGARGYRAAQFEAGVVAGRLALCAFALGAGATGLTFYDERVSRYFGTSASPMLATAVGLPARTAVGGGSPGNPLTLR